ncbi:MAG: FtsB family cell division protein [Opitutales bacterium]
MGKIAFSIVSMSARSKQSTNPRRERVLILMLAGVLVVMVLFFASLLLKTHREFENFKARQHRIEMRLTQARNEFAQKEAYLRRLMEDPEFLERVARERLGYSRPDELLFRFSDDL